MMGYGTVVLDPDPPAPAGRGRRRAPRRRVRRRAALDQLAATCAVVTTEFENPPAGGAASGSPPTSRRPVAGGRRHRPGPDRREGVPRRARACRSRRSPWSTHVADDVDGAGRRFPAILKTARLGYDGKGQRAVADARRARGGVAASWAACRACSSRRVPLDAELSVVVARTAGGDGRRLPGRRERPRRRDPRPHRRAGPVSPRPVADRAAGLAMAIADALDYVGVLAVELFVSDGELLVNELAPRPHNSGHWTLDVAHDQPVRPAGAGGVRARARRHGDDRARRRRWSTCSATCGPAASRDWDGGARRSRRPPPPVRQGGGPARAARWATSRARRAPAERPSCCAPASARLRDRLTR